MNKLVKQLQSSDTMQSGPDWLGKKAKSEVTVLKQNLDTCNTDRTTLEKQLEEMTLKYNNKLKQLHQKNDRIKKMQQELKTHIGLRVKTFLLSGWFFKNFKESEIKDELLKNYIGFIQESLYAQFNNIKDVYGHIEQDKLKELLDNVGCIYDDQRHILDIWKDLNERFPSIFYRKYIETKQHGGEGVDVYEIGIINKTSGYVSVQTHK